MILKAVHKLASFGPVYDLIQTALGVNLAYRRFKKVLDSQATYHTVLDLGGGTGRIREILDTGCKYYCLDNEAPKLTQFRKHTPDGLAILGDATLAPIADASMDLIICIAVSHHLDDFDFNRLLLEIRRVLRPSGRLMLFDPVWKPSWLTGRLLWSLDRGSNPRTREAMLGILENHVRIVHREDFRMAHEYTLVMAEDHSPRTIRSYLSGIRNVNIDDAAVSDLQ